MKKIILSIFIILSLTTLVFADTNGIWNYVKDLRPGTFGSDEYTGNYIFNDNLTINGSSHTFLKINSPNSNYASYLTLFENNIKKWSVGQNPLWASGSNNFYIYKQGSLSADHSSINGLTINNSNGYVGIGITDPKARLHIKDSYASVFLDTTDHTHSSWISFFEKGIKKWSVGQNPLWSSGSNDFYIYDVGSLSGTSLYGLVIKKDTGDLGIGTIDPQARLHIKDDFASIIIDANTNSQASYLSLRSSGTKEWSVGQNPGWAVGSNDFYIYGNSGETLVIKKASNNVGIATTNPTEKLDVNGKIRMQSQTLSTDADDIVATKKYVDDNIGFPTGAIIAFNLVSCPSGWILADGTSGTPDLRGVFIRGLDNGRGLDSGRTLGSYQADELKSHRHSLSAGKVSRASGTGHHGGNMHTSNSGLYSDYTGGSETRPKNVALIYCMKQ